MNYELEHAKYRKHGVWIPTSEADAKRRRDLRRELREAGIALEDRLEILHNAGEWFVRYSPNGS